MINKLSAKKALFLLVSGIFLMLVALPAQSALVNVPGTSDPWLAGMPNGSLDNVGTLEPADAAPAYSPVLVPFAITSGMTLQWTATGIVGHPGDAAGPDGASAVLTTHAVGANNGISDIHVPIDSLVGVFLGPGQPDLNPAPSALDFSTGVSQNYLALAPDLKQVFFMGDGVTSGFAAQTIVAPTGATRLYLGTMDGYGWANNIGSFDVTINAVPEPFTLLFLGACLTGFAIVSRRMRKC